MRKRQVSLFGVSFAVLIVLVIAFLLRLTMHRPPAVTLPETGDEQNAGDVVRESGGTAIRRVEVTPETVQRVIERIARPENYSRTVTLERFWTGGSGQTSASVSVMDGWTRVDAAENGGEERHVITGDGKSWIWYGSEERVFTGAAAISADEEQGIPTYEDVLRLNTAYIAAADYREFNGVNCIYVETAPDAAGYSECWWVSVESGLLIAAERFEGEALVYRLTALEADLGGVDEQAFLLPDGELPFPLDEEPDAEQTDTEQTQSEG